MGNTYNRIYIWCCKYGENRYCERCANKKWCASKHTGLLNSCLGKLCLHPYLVVPLISARVTLISTRVSAHCQAILFIRIFFGNISFKQKHFHPRPVLAFGYCHCLHLGLCVSEYVCVSVTCLSMWAETTIEGLETRPLSREILPQCSARLLVAVSRVLIRHGVCCGNTYWTVFSEKFCVERIWDWVSKHNKSYTVWSRIICRLQ